MMTSIHILISYLVQGCDDWEIFFFDVNTMDDIL